ncbi:hypothetical protein BdWA1_000244 [Babesia duncani]|uniref:Uncharacterized protein n=1 Tax=Babesia duncani TaxID=323732 RepID=A0AAD9UPX2_9APIC|nr:hypothetical protein BdWA1_000244 [Babesia duncani]
MISRHVSSTLKCITSANLKSNRFFLEHVLPIESKAIDFRPVSLWNPLHPPSCSTDNLNLDLGIGILQDSLNLGIKDGSILYNVTDPMINVVIENPNLTLPIPLQDIIHEKCIINPQPIVEHLFNKLRNDSKHRKRAFTKRGCFRQTHAMIRKDNRLRLAYALQGIDYDMLEGLEIGEIPDLSLLKK